MKNGAETGVDCGGPTCPACPCTTHALPPSINVDAGQWSANFFSSPTWNCNAAGTTTIDTTAGTVTSTSCNLCTLDVTNNVTQTTAGGPSVMVVRLKGLTVSNNHVVKVVGNKPVVFLVAGNVVVDSGGKIDADAAAGTAGAGGNVSCGSSTGGAGTGSSGLNGSGGGGGGFGTNGGAGGSDGPAVGAAGVARGTAALTPLMGGCGGGTGGGYTCTPGAGGGAVEISASGTLTVTATGIVSANGGVGANGCGNDAGGAGGGSGGGILLVAPTVSTPGVVRANGGNGGDGQASGSPGVGSTSSGANGGNGGNGGGSGAGGGGGGYGRTLASAGTTTNACDSAPATPACCVNADCTSNRCETGFCRTCSDGVKTGTETGVDCGGVCGATCPVATACGAGTDCTSTFCADGVCCNSACGASSASDCQACNTTAGGAVTGTCGAVQNPTAGTILCDSQANICEAPAYCNGVSMTCPSGLAAQGTDCGYTGAGYGGFVMYQGGAPGFNAADFAASGFASASATNVTTGIPQGWDGNALKFTATSSASGANFEYWKTIGGNGATGNAPRALAAADLFEYDVYVTNNVDGVGGLDIKNSDGTYWRDCNAATCGTWQDQNALGGHPATSIAAQAFGKWYHRRLPIPQGATTYVGKTISYVDLVDENNTNSLAATMYYDNVIITQLKGACDGAGTCKRKTGVACGAGTDCASGTCTASVCQ